MEFGLQLLIVRVRNDEIIETPVIRGREKSEL